MKNASRGNLYHFSRRFISLFVSITFVFTNFFVAPSYAASASLPAEQKSLPSDLSNIAIPQEFGKIQEMYQTDSALPRSANREPRKGRPLRGMRVADRGSPAVILIQDAHAIPDAQKNIQRLIDYFQKQYGVDLVALEGAASKLDPQIFKSFPDKEALKKVLAGYHNRGELAGAVAAAILNESKSIYQGIENWKLYERGLELYLQASQQEPVISEKMDGLNKALQSKKSKVYSKELLEIEQTLDHFYRNHSSLLEVLKKLASIKEPARGSELALLLGEAKRLPDENQSVETEVKRIAEKIKNILNQRAVTKQGKSSLSLFNEKYQDFQTSRVQPQAFALFLKEIAAEGHLPIKVSGLLSHLMENQKRMRDIEGTRFFRDFERYVDSVKEVLFRNEEEKKLDQESRRLEILGRLIPLELSREEWNEAKKLIVSLRAERSNLGDRFVASLLAMTNKMDAHISFYENAEKRDEAFASRLIPLMQENKANSALLVAGGFHAEGLTQRLKERNISYVLVMPQISFIPEDNHYRDHMRGEVSWKNYFEVENGKVNLYKAFVRATRDRLLGVRANPRVRPDFDSKDGQTQGSAPTLLKSWRDQIIRDLAAKDEITKVQNHTRFIDEIAGKNFEDPWRSEWLANIEKFVEALDQLDARGQLTEQNVLNLLKPSTTIPPATGTDVLTEPASVAAPIIGIIRNVKGWDGASAKLYPQKANTFRSEARADLQSAKRIGQSVKPGDALRSAPGAMPEGTIRRSEARASGDDFEIELNEFRHKLAAAYREAEKIEMELEWGRAFNNFQSIEQIIFSKDKNLFALPYRVHGFFEEIEEMAVEFNTKFEDSQGYSNERPMEDLAIQVTSLLSKAAALYEQSQTLYQDKLSESLQLTLRASVTPVRLIIQMFSTSFFLGSSAAAVAYFYFLSPLKESVVYGIWSGLLSAYVIFSREMSRYFNPSLKKHTTPQEKFDLMQRLAAGLSDYWSDDEEIKPLVEALKSIKNLADETYERHAPVRGSLSKMIRELTPYRQQLLDLIRPEGKYPQLKEPIVSLTNLLPTKKPSSVRSEVRVIDDWKDLNQGDLSEGNPTPKAIYDLLFYLIFHKGFVPRILRREDLPLGVLPEAADLADVTFHQIRGTQLAGGHLLIKFYLGVRKDGRRVWLTRYNNVTSHSQDLSLLLSEDWERKSPETTQYLPQIVALLQTPSGEIRHGRIEDDLRPQERRLLLAVSQELNPQNFTPADLEERGFRRPWTYLFNLVRTNYLRKGEIKNGSTSYQFTDKATQMIKEVRQTLEIWEIPSLFAVQRRGARRGKPYDPPVAKRFEIAKEKILAMPDGRRNLRNLSQILAVNLPTLRQFLAAHPELYNDVFLW